MFPVLEANNSWKDKCSMINNTQSSVTTQATTPGDQSTAHASVLFTSKHSTASHINKKLKMVKLEDGDQLSEGMHAAHDHTRRLFNKLVGNLVAC